MQIQDHAGRVVAVTDPAPRLGLCGPGDRPTLRRVEPKVIHEFKVDIGPGIGQHIKQQPARDTRHFQPQWLQG